MWPFDRLSSRARKLVAAFAIAAQLAFSFQAAKAESTEAKALWSQVQRAKNNYDNSKTTKNARLLKNSLQEYVRQLKKDAEELPKGSKERQDIEKEIARLQVIINSIPTSEKGTVKFPPEVMALLNNTSTQILSGDYNLENPLTIKMEGEVVVLLTSKELTEIVKSTESIKNLSLRKKSIVNRMMTKIMAKPEITKKFTED